MDPKVEVEVFPSCKILVNMVQRQLDVPGSGLGVTQLCSSRGDDPVLALAYSSANLNDEDDVLKGEDKKADLMWRKTHQAAAWAVETATAASFFSRTAVLWLRQLQQQVLLPSPFCRLEAIRCEDIELEDSSIMSIADCNITLTTSNKNRNNH
ncbi:hypothetical protein E2320_014216 [Naja naja]|nr:hypothetical protein E2320_014216 [Naja naja]